MYGISEPHEAVDAYYVGLDEAWERLVKHATCADCNHYTAAPDEWVDTPCGWCNVDEDIIRGDESVKRIECEGFDPRPGYEPCEDVNEDDFPESWEYDDMED